MTHSPIRSRLLAHILSLTSSCQSLVTRTLPRARSGANPGRYSRGWAWATSEATNRATASMPENPIHCLCISSPPFVWGQLMYLCHTRASHAHTSNLVYRLLPWYIQRRGTVSVAEG